MPDTRQFPAPPIAGDSVARGRTRRLLAGTASVTLSKVVVLVVNALSIPITIRYLGAESFGVWMTVATILSMLLMLDLGVANSLTNFLSEAYARNDRGHAGMYATTAFGVMVALAAVLGLMAWVVWPHVDWGSLFHLSGHGVTARVVGNAVAAALAVFLLGLPASLAPKILGGYQELHSASLFQAFGSVCNLIFLLVLTHRHASLPSLVAGSFGSLVVVNYACLGWIWIFHKPWLSPRRHHLNRDAARRMMHMGSELFLLQIAALVVFNSDNIVVTHYLGPREVASYSVAWRLVTYAAAAQTLIAPALWPAFSEAFARGDMPWVRRTFRRTMSVTMGVALAFSALFAVAGRRIIEVWASRSAVPSEHLMLLMCGWTVLLTYMNNTSMVLVAKGATRLQAYCSIAAAVLNLALSIFWVQRIGASGVILGTIVSYLLVLVVPQTWKVVEVLRGPSPELQVQGVKE